MPLPAIFLRKLRENPSKRFRAINAKVRLAAPCSLLGTIHSSSIRPLGFEDQDEHDPFHEERKKALHEHGGASVLASPNFYPLEIRARRSLAPPYSSG